MGNDYCSNCGAELKFQEAEICPTCGVGIKKSLKKSLHHNCPTCGNKLKFEEAEICPACGVRVKNGIYTFQPNVSNNYSLIGGILGLIGILFVTIGSQSLFAMGIFVGVISIIAILGNYLKNQRISALLSILCGIIIFIEFINVWGAFLNPKDYYNTYFFHLSFYALIITIILWGLSVIFLEYSGYLKLKNKITD